MIRLKNLERILTWSVPEKKNYSECALKNSLVKLFKRLKKKKKINDNT